jgi:hypothetical protein
MSDRIQKPKQKKLPVSSSLRRDNLLSAILLNSVTMSACSSCEARGLRDCQVSEKDSSRCSECVRLKRAKCDVLGPSPADLAKMGSQLSALEEELDSALAKVERLRRQKKMWFEKMMRAVRRGITSVEELERVEKEEADREATRVAENRPPSATSFSFDDDFIPNWDAVHGDVVLSPATLEVMMPLWSETAAATAGSSGG